MTDFWKISFQAGINKRKENPKSHKFDEPNEKPRLEEYFIRLYTGKQQKTGGHTAIYMEGKQGEKEREKVLFYIFKYL